MIKYKIFFFGYGGSVFDAFLYGIIPEDLEGVEQTDCFAYLALLNRKGLLRKDLKFTVLPIFAIA